MFPVILFLFIVVPIVEIALFIQVGGFLGLWTTIALVLITAVLGASLVRSQGLQTLMSAQSRMQHGELPAQEIMEGVLLAVAGVLLLTPGFMTDAMGMTVLLPGPRSLIAKYCLTKFKVGASSASFHGFSQQGGNHQGPFDRSSRTGGDTFEGEYERKDDDKDKDRLE
ncbi:FxsA family protein [Veronia pacifica]|uniref:Membrane protein FxsA n=1 Tax=Veronia pacifica TaxID=1080227 RepID=A0A1C3EC21_9GAMM|nr:FxsA family protein [Veronia pacifica]ODA30778.1 membrane protein FxsA [Veronia pacifica]